MPLDFPTSPVLNELYTFGGKTWKWDGAGWVSYNVGLIGPAGATGATGATGADGAIGSIALDDLTDVEITGVSAADILYYGGTGWINKPFNDIPIDGGIY